MEDLTIIGNGIGFVEFLFTCEYWSRAPPTLFSSTAPTVVEAINGCCCSVSAMLRVWSVLLLAARLGLVGRSKETRKEDGEILSSPCWIPGTISFLSAAVVKPGSRTVKVDPPPLPPEEVMEM